MIYGLDSDKSPDNYCSMLNSKQHKDDNMYIKMAVE
jgi:hypothetical protein